MVHHQPKDLIWHCTILALGQMAQVIMTILSLTASTLYSQMAHTLTIVSQFGPCFKTYQKIWFILVYKATYIVLLTASFPSLPDGNDFTSIDIPVLLLNVVPWEDLKVSLQSLRRSLRSASTVSKLSCWLFVRRNCLTNGGYIISQFSFSLTCSPLMYSSTNRWRRRRLTNSKEMLPFWALPGKDRLMSER